MTQLLSISEAKFSATAVHQDADIVLQLTGSADVVAKHHLAGLLRELHEQAKALGVHEVKIDIRRLAFMNSSCFKDIITWLERARADHGYRIVFLSSAGQHWQKRSLHALSCFARDLVSIEAS
ncbi:MAG TPA: hypothetical protein VHO06_04765 [Polyangia bacterium]|nr:hypothetical protein [Polyangia bacterium]